MSLKMRSIWRSQRLRVSFVLVQHLINNKDESISRILRANTALDLLFQAKEY